MIFKITYHDHIFENRELTIRADPKLPIRKVAFNFALDRETSRRRLRDPEIRKENHVSQ